MIQTLEEFVAHVRELLSSLPLTDAVDQTQHDALKDSLECAEAARDAVDRDGAVKSAILAGMGFGYYLAVNGEAGTLRDGNKAFFRRRKGGYRKRATGLPDNDVLEQRVAELRARHAGKWSLRTCYAKVGLEHGVSGSTIEKRLRRR